MILSRQAGNLLRRAKRADDVCNAGANCTCWKGRYKQRPSVLHRAAPHPQHPLTCTRVFTRSSGVVTAAEVTPASRDASVCTAITSAPPLPDGGVEDSTVRERAARLVLAWVLGVGLGLTGLSGAATPVGTVGAVRDAVMPRSHLTAAWMGCSVTPGCSCCCAECCTPGVDWALLLLMLLLLTGLELRSVGRTSQSSCWNRPSGGKVRGATGKKSFGLVPQATEQCVKTAWLHPYQI